MNEDICMQPSVIDPALRAKKTKKKKTPHSSVAVGSNIANIYTEDHNQMIISHRKFWKGLNQRSEFAVHSFPLAQKSKLFQLTS